MSSARPSSCTAWVSTRFTPASMEVSMADPVPLHPGATSLATWRALYRSPAPAPFALASGHEAAVEASAAAVRAIIARGEPVYGINTGFGKLASVRIADA